MMAFVKPRHEGNDAEAQALDDIVSAGPLGALAELVAHGEHGFQWWHGVGDVDANAPTSIVYYENNIL